MKLDSPLPSYVFYIAVVALLIAGFAFIKVMEVAMTMQATKLQQGLNDATGT